VYSLGALPRIGERFVSRCAYITSDQRVHSLGSDVGSCLSCASNLGHLCVKDSLFVRVNFKGCQDIDLLNQKKWSVLFS